MGKYKTTKILTGIFWVISALLLVAAGICCLVSPNAVLEELSYIIGAFMMITGVISFVCYIFISRETIGGESFLFQSLITFFLGLLICLNNVIVSKILIYGFSVWIFIIGLMRIMSSMRFRELKMPKWWLFLIEGIIAIILGAVSFFIPSTTASLLGIFSGIYLIIIGGEMLSDFIFLQRFKKEIRRIYNQSKSQVIDITPDDEE